MAYCAAKTLSNIAGTFCKPFTDNSLLGSRYSHYQVGYLVHVCFVTRLLSQTQNKEFKNTSLRTRGSD